jgi:excisionase family DNA binding protein
VLLTVAQAAEQLSVSKRTVWRLIRSGELVAIRLRHLVRIPVEDFNAYIDGLARIRHNAPSGPAVQSKGGDSTCQSEKQIATGSTAGTTRPIGGRVIPMRGVDEYEEVLARIAAMRQNSC